MASAVSRLPSALVLEIDRDLGGNIDPAEWEVVRQVCRAELLPVARGPWPAAREASGRDDLVAFVVVEGLLAREVSLRDRSMVELLGQTDVLRPPLVTRPVRLGTGTRLTAVSDLQMLVLGQPFLRAAARWPTLLTTLHQRLELQRASLAIQGLIAHLPKTEERVLLLLRLLADRWGYVTPDGIVLPWPLSHEILGRLIGTRRPTVTIALRELKAGGLVDRREDGSWLLTGAAGQMIDAIAQPNRAPHSVGERLMLYRQITETRSIIRALRAEARQIRTRRLARPPDEHARTKIAEQKPAG